MRTLVFFFFFFLFLFFFFFFFFSFNSLLFYVPCVFFKISLEFLSSYYSFSRCCCFVVVVFLGGRGVIRTRHQSCMPLEVIFCCFRHIWHCICLDFCFFLIIRIIEICCYHHNNFTVANISPHCYHNYHYQGYQYPSAST